MEWSTVVCHNGRELYGPRFFVNVPYDDGFAYRRPPTGDPFEIDPWKRRPAGDVVSTLAFYDGITVVQ